MDSINVPVDALSILCTESWRLCKLSKDGTVEGYASRRINDQLNALGLVIIDLVGQPYDPGLAPEVVDNVFDVTISPGQSLISETIAPLVMLNGAVIQPGQIVVTSGPATEG